RDQPRREACRPGTRVRRPRWQVWPAGTASGTVNLNENSSVKPTKRGRRMRRHPPATEKGSTYSFACPCTKLPNFAHADGNVRRGQFGPHGALCAFDIGQDVPLALPAALPRTDDVARVAFAVVAARLEEQPE